MSARTAEKQDAQLRDAARRVAEALGLEVYDLVARRSGPRWKVQVFLTRPLGAVTLIDCERVSRQLSRELDVLDPIAHAYDLEVSSPGVERPLREIWHWRRAIGEKVSVRWRDAGGGARSVVAILEAADEQMLRLRSDAGEEFQIPPGAVLAARIHVDW